MKENMVNPVYINRDCNSAAHNPKIQRYMKAYWCVVRLTDLARRDELEPLVNDIDKELMDAEDIIGDLRMSGLIRLMGIQKVFPNAKLYTFGNAVEIRVEEYVVFRKEIIAVDATNPVEIDETED